MISVKLFSFSIRVAVGSMVCALPFGVLVLLVSFIALRIAVGKYMPDNQGQNGVSTNNTKSQLNYGITAIIVFPVVYLIALLRSKTIAGPLLHLSVFNSIAIYFINSRPSLKSFVKSKLIFIVNRPFNNTVHVQNIDV